MSIKITKLSPAAQRVLKGMRLEEQSTNGELDEERDVNIDDVNALVDMARATQDGDAQAAKARLSEQGRKDLEHHQRVMDTIKPRDEE